MIGVSNVTADQLTLLCMKAKHKPMVVQNRCYAAFGWDKEVTGDLPDAAYYLSRLLAS